MSAKPILKYRRENNTFVLECPPWMIDIARAIPNRRWHNPSKSWLAPALRANAKYFRELGPDLQKSPEAAEKIDEVIDQYNNIKRQEFPAWFGFKTQPWKHQRECLNKMYGQKVGALIMDMGTGKTKVWLDLACCLRAEGKIEQAVVVCPYSIHGEWNLAIETHATLPISLYELDTRRQREFQDWLDRPHDFKMLLVGLEALSAGGAKDMVEQFLMRSNKNAMLVDESSGIKNHAATRTQEITRLGRMCEYRHIATGTPIAHGPTDFFAQFEFLDPNIIGIGDFWSFRNRYAIMGGFEGKQIVGYQNIDELMELVKPFSYQALKKDVFPDLPPKVFSTRRVKMAPEQISVYKQFKRQVDIEIDGKSKSVQNILERMLRLSQITSGFWVSEEIEVNDNLEIIREEQEINPLPTPKIAEMLKVVDETDLPTIVWSNHLYELKMAAAALKKQYGNDQVVELHGGVDKADRPALIDRFKSGKARFFVSNTQTGGLGLNLFNAQVMIYLSNSYKLIDRLQSEDRAWRAGQVNRLSIIDIVCEGTVDELIKKCIDAKTDVAEYIREQLRNLEPVL